VAASGTQIDCTRRGTRWRHVAGEPTAADSAGPYSHEQLVRMDSDFVGAVERAFASGGESPLFPSGR
jgi:hypothetical protein